MYTRDGGLRERARVHLGLRGVVLHEVVGVVPRHAVHVGDLVAELDAVELAGVLQKLGPAIRKQLS